MAPMFRTTLRVALLTMLASTLSSQKVAAAEAAGAPELNAASAHFDILEFRVLGNHVLAPVAIERAVYSFLGPDRDISVVRRAADALEKAYKDAGYGTVFVDIPEQEVADGIVRLKVTEGRLDAVHVNGERYFSGREIRAALPALEPGQTPNLPAVQQQLSALNSRTADRSITPILKAGPEPGTVDVDLAVKDVLPLHGSIEYDNRHTADTTPNRAAVALSYDNLWGRQDSIGVQYQTAPARTSDARVLVAIYNGHVTGTEGTFGLSYINTHSDVLALGTLGVLGTGSIYGLHWQQPLTQDAVGSQSLNGGLDYKDVLTRVFPDQADGAADASVSAPVKYLNWSLQYAGGWRHDTHDLLLTAGLSFGVRSVINSTDQFENARFNGAPGYLYLRLGLSANQILPARFALRERFSSQWSDYPLVNNEQYSLGGADTVRGYLEAETLGDSGAAGSFELHSPPARGWLGHLASPLYAFAFIDGGFATIVNPLPSQQRRTNLWSLGLGLRLESPTGLSGGLDWADPRVTGGRTQAGDERVDFTARYAF